jgi:putative cardiolipin synthase
MKSILLTVLIAFSASTHLFCNDSILLLADEKVALDCKLDLMLQARKSISLSYYAINEDEIGLLFAAMTCFKATQGVITKVIIEKSRSKVTEQLIKIFKEYGVEIKYYNSFHIFKLKKNFSWLHDKLIVIDSTYVILGGRNLNNKYYPNSEKPTELTDVETLLKGSSGAIAEQYTQHLFSSRFANRIHLKKKDKKHYIELRKKIEDNIELIKNKTSKNWDSLLSPVNTAIFIHDNYKKWPKSKAISDTILSTIQHAKKNIIAVSPYLIPPLHFMRAIKKASNRGVHITLISNSAQISDAKIIAAAYMNDRKKYLKLGIDIYEYNGKKMLHDKLFLIDDSIAIVGSYNFDNISYKMNSEVITKITDSIFGSSILKHIQERKEESFMVYHAKDKNPYNDKATSRRTKWNRILLKIFPFIRRFL